MTTATCGAALPTCAATPTPTPSKQNGAPRSIGRSRQASTSRISTPTWVRRWRLSGAIDTSRSGVEYDVPVLITSELGGYDPNNHLADVTEEQFAPFVAAARAARMPVFGRVLETDFGRPRDRPVDYEGQLHSSHEALVYCAFHPCRPGPGEIENIEPGAHHVRVDEYELFRTSSWKDWLDAQDEIEPIGMRTLRDDRRTAAAEANA